MTKNAEFLHADPIVADGLTCIRGGRPVFADVQFAVGSGELLALVGPNGAGKSSLLRILAGLLEPAGGTLTPDPRRALQGLVHYLGHLDGLKAALTLRANLAYWQAVYSTPGGAGGPNSGLDAFAATRKAGIDHLLDLPVAVFSAGQRRRAGLARILMAGRPIWLLDEPTSSLDTDGVAVLGACMSAHLAEGGTIFAATHEELPVAASRTLAMDSQIEPAA